MSSTTCLFPIKAFEQGIYLWLPPESLVNLGAQNINKITKAATMAVMEPGETQHDAPVRMEIQLWKGIHGGIAIPKTLVSKLPQDWNWDIEPGTEGENVKLSLGALKYLPVNLEPLQMEILQAVRNAPTSGLIDAAMGAGKSWILIAIALGHPMLRPCAISGKGEKDTKQLIDKLRDINKAHPEIAEPIMLSGLGRTLSKKDKKVLEGGEGIVVCTHAGLKNLPPNVKLLVLDEAHAASTAKRISAIAAFREIKKLYTLSGTASMRGDGGDEALSMLAGPTLTVKTHADFEAAGRVTPAQINAYHFTGKGIYAENPYMPDQTPQEGYSLHSTWVENHRGRHQFVADLLMWLPDNETKIVFVPHVLHAVRIQAAVERKIKDIRGDLTRQQIENLTPVIFHAKAEKNTKFYMSKEEREELIQALIEGKIRSAIATDFLSTGFDSNMIDHVIDASGQKAIITNIQRSGRGVRIRTLPDGSQKILQIHTILDKTHPVMHKMGESKLMALCGYYEHQIGVPTPDRLGGAQRFYEPPWIPVEDRAQTRLTDPHEVFRSKPDPAQQFNPADYRRPKKP